MAKRSQARKNRPLVENPVSKVFSFNHDRASLDVEVTVAPEQWIYYAVSWTKKPPAGIRACFSGQLSLLKGRSQSGDRLQTLRLMSDGNFFGGKTNNKGQPAHVLHSYQLDDVIDFNLSGLLLEEV